MPKISKYLFYLLVFFLPLFALPQANLSAVFSKKVFLAVFIFLILFCWLVQVLISGKIKYKGGKVSKILFLFLLISAISFALSGFSSQSFFGEPLQTDSLFVFILYGLIFFFALNLLETEKEILHIIKIFLVSSGILSFLFFIQYFSGSISFNPIGSVQALSLFLGIALVFLISLVINNPAEFKLSNRRNLIIAITLGVLFFSSIFLINFKLTWFLIALSSIIILWQVIDKNLQLTTYNLQLKILPLIILILSLTLFFIELPLGKNFLPEIYPAYQHSWQVAKSTLAEGPENFFFGSGPATFPYQFSLHKGEVLNQTAFSSTVFDQGQSAFFTLLTTIGVLGVMSLLFLIGFFFYQGFNKPFILFAGGFYLALLFFFYPVNLTLTAFGFLILGLWQNTGTKLKELNFFEISSKKSFIIMIACSLLMVGAILGIYNIVRQYRAELSFLQAIRLYDEQKPDQSLSQVEKTLGIWEKDNYYLTLSKLELLKASEIFQNQETFPTEEQKNILQNLLTQAETSAQFALQFNPKNSQNYQNLGWLYENLIFLKENAVQLSLEAYQKAQELDPQNYNYPIALARIYQLLGDQTKADEYKQKALELKPSLQINTDL